MRVTITVEVEPEDPSYPLSASSVIEDIRLYLTHYFYDEAYNVTSVT